MPRKFITVVFIIGLLFVVGCPRPPAPAPEPPPVATQTPKPTPTPTPVEVESPPANVEIVGVEFTGSGPQYDLIATVRNNGPGTAYVNGLCSWKCPAGIESSGAKQLFSGELMPERRDRQILVWTMASGTCAVPLEVECKLTVHSLINGYKAGSQTKTVAWSQAVRIP